MALHPIVGVSLPRIKGFQDGFQIRFNHDQDKVVVED